MPMMEVFFRYVSVYVTYDAKLFAYVREFTTLPKVKNSIFN
jgi:hypothetical protein